MSNSTIIIKLFEESLRDLMRFHYQKDYPFFKEADAQSFLFMRLFKKLKSRNLLFTKEGFLTLRSNPKYPFEKGMKMLDLGIVSPDFNEIDQNGGLIKSHDYKYLIAAEMKLDWLSSRDIKKLSRLLEERKAENCYLVLLGKRKEPVDELLEPTDISKKFYQIKPRKKISKSKIKVFYSFIFEGQKGIDAERFEIKSKNNVTVLTKKDVIAG